MATLLNNSTGNFTSASTWSLVDSTSYLNSETNSTANTTSLVSSQSFVPGAITTDGLAIKVLSHTQTGNITVRLGKTGTITANTLANPTVVTSANHGLTTGEAILISGSNSTPALSGPYTVTVTGTNTFTVPVNVTVAGTTGTWITVLANITSNTLVATPVFTTSVAHGLTVGTTIVIRGSTATPSYNGSWVVATTPGASTFTLTGAPSAVGGVSGWGTYNISGVPDTVVVAAAADLPTVNTATNTGWSFFKFPSPLTLTTGTSYTVQISGSTAANITSYRNATAGNWSRILRTTTNQAPVAGDGIIISGEHTGIGAESSFTVTNDNTTTTQYASLEVSCMGTFSSGVAASTNYYFKLNNSPTVYTGGVFNIGTVGTPIPSTSTSKLEIVCSSNVQFGLEIRSGGTMNTGGNVITNKAFLAADASAAATSLTTNVSTGWKSGDVIGIASTTRTKAESESKALTADASGTTLTITALTNAHSGTSPIAAELINLTRNVVIFSASTTNQTYVNIAALAIVDFESTEFYNMGSATALKRGIDVATTTGSCTINNCSIHDFNVASSIGVNFNSTSGNNHIFTNNNIYNTASSGLVQSVTTGTAYTINNIITMLTGATGFSLSDLGGTITNITGISATGAGITFSDSAGTAFGTLNGFTAHANTTIGISFSTVLGITNNPMSTFYNLTSYRNTTTGIALTNTFSIALDTVTAFGNATANLGIGSTECDNVYFNNMTINSGTTLTCPLGFNTTTDCHEIYIDNSTFGATTTHATADLSAGGTLFFVRYVLRNTALNSTTPVSNTTTMTEGSFVSMAKVLQTAGNHKTFKKYGTVTTDTIIYNSGPVSARLTPNNAASTNKLQGPIKKIAVPSGQTATVKVFIRKSVVGDGTAYNGNQPRLMLRMDPAAGVMSDTVLATADNTYNGVFKQLSATTPAITDNAVFQVYVDCDGTTGWINQDDWSVS